MNPEEANNNSGSGGQAWDFQWAGLALVVLLAAFIRGAILFGSPLVPGMNGAYYLVQARSVLLHGTLGIPDLPLTFYVQAFLARTVQWLSGWSLDSSILFAVKLADSAFPALLAVPVFLLVRRWALSAKAPAWIALSVAALVTLNDSVLMMVGDFQKNSLGLVWLAALLLFVHRWLTRPTARNAAGVLCFWGLGAVTHIGVFGASLTFGALAILFCLVLHRTETWRALWPLLVAAAIVGALAAGVVLLKFDAHRIQKLTLALTHPSDFLTGDNIQPHGGRGGGGPGGPMPGFPGGPPRAIQSPACFLFALSSIAALVACWRRRKTLPAADVCVVGACAVGVLLLTGPWVHGEKTMRFNLIAITPAVLAGTFAVLHWKWSWARWAVAFLAAIAMIGPTFQRAREGGHAEISEQALSELRSLAPLISEPGKTLIVARHGLEWWTAWTLHTHIAQSSALQPSDWQAFDAVYFLRSKDGMGPMHGGHPPDSGLFGMLFGGFSRLSGPPSGPRGNPPVWGMPGMQGPPPPHGGPGSGGNPMDGPDFPPDAETIHDGNSFALSRIASPPAFVLEQASDRNNGLIRRSY